MTLKLLLAVAVGGAVGSVGRYVTGVLIGRLLGMGFPWGTLLVNILGSFLMGALVEWAALRGVMSQEARTFIFVGVLGGFTTFSSFSLDVATLFERGALAMSAAYLTATIMVGVAALFIGLYTARTLLT